MTDKPILLLDGDQYVFKTTISLEHEVKWDEQNHVLMSNLEECYSTVVASIEKTRKALGGGEVRIAFSQGHNFRKDILPTYKGNRQNTRKPLCYAALVERLYENYKCLGVDGLEADDIMGIWATRSDQETIIVSADKDMKTIPGKVYREGEVMTISSLEADYNHLFQTLIGDSTDGYSGCPGVGPKKAEKLLMDRYPGETPLESMWRVVVQAYEKAGLTEDDALVQARVARILRASDWDSVNKEVILWKP